MSTRTDLLNLLREQERTSSFQRLTVRSIYDQVASTTELAQQTAAIVSPTVEGGVTQQNTIFTSKAGTNPTLRYRPNGFYFSVTLDFAIAKQIAGDGYTPEPPLDDQEKEDWGTGFGNPLVKPHRNCIYVVRCRIDQLRVDPMVGGFKLTWLPPNGWKRVDGQPATMYVEASSNPLLIARKYRTPDFKQKRIVFRIEMKAWYP